MSKIYTRTGDHGDTGLYGSRRVPKNDPLIDALGTIDECNSAIGLALSFLSKGTLQTQLELIQHRLFDAGAELAGSKQPFDSTMATTLEQWIDAMQVELPPLNAFILPGGCPAGAALHLARSICRRAERALIPYKQKAFFIFFSNRLSDYLFGRPQRQFSGRHGRAALAA